MACRDSWNMKVKQCSPAVHGFCVDAHRVISDVTQLSKYEIRSL